MRRQISVETWEQIKTAFASGIRLREIARNMSIPEGTILARASREQWTPRIEAAKSLAKPVERAIVPACDAAAQTLQARSERHVARMAGITDKVLPHLEAMEPGQILDSARNLERFDYVTRRNFGLDLQPPGGCTVNLAILTNQAMIVESTPGLASAGIAVDRSCIRLQSKAAEMQSGAAVRNSTVVFYGQTIFGCKTLQSSATIPGHSFLVKHHIATLCKTAQNR